MTYNKFNIRTIKDKLGLFDPDYVSLSFSNPYQVLAALQWIVDTSLAAATDA